MGESSTQNFDESKKINSQPKKRSTYAGIVLSLLLLLIFVLYKNCTVAPVIEVSADVNNSLTKTSLAAATYMTPSTDSNSQSRMKRSFAAKPSYACFTPVRQNILVGFAYYVLENVPSVDVCLKYCAKSQPGMGRPLTFDAYSDNSENDFECKSVMYYYNEQECILNSESRTTKPDMFIPEGEDFKVDYFDVARGLKKKTCAGIPGYTKGDECTCV